MLETAQKGLDTQAVAMLERFGSSLAGIGMNLAVCDAQGQILLLCECEDFKSDRRQLRELCLKALKDADSTECLSHHSHACKINGTNSALACVFCPEQDKTKLIILIDYGPKKHNKMQLSQTETMLTTLFELLIDNYQANTKTSGQIEKISVELAEVYEELVLLHRLSTNMRVTESDSNFLQLACDSLTSIVNVEGIAILLERTANDEKQLKAAAGSGLIDVSNHMPGILYDRLVENLSGGKEALLDSEVDSPFRYDWPDNIKSIIAVPLCGKSQENNNFTKGLWDSQGLMGLIVAINRVDKPDFDSTDVKLFNSVANSCAVFVENGRLFKDLKDLFIGSLKALTSSIDAKDQYTRGHSERVAIISRWLGERLTEEESLDKEQLSTIYLAGLLHDIGKMGVDEAVLHKQGKLTEQEYEQIKMHPSIGAGILSQIKQMRSVVPGVLHHHERVDGKGYPDALRGDEIPLIGKIVGLADSFDAMTSKRTYRDAMTVEEALDNIKVGLGSQFDEKVGKAFISGDIYQLWDIMQGNFSRINEHVDAVADSSRVVGSLIR
ncbi:MAG: HD domain-containing protein [Sedimentisphaerales bacterium]|nr:HD domain-containing protein [Sedimentisphaerales bacterium]